MLTKIVIYNRVVAEAKRVSDALRNYLRMRKQMKIVALSGTIDFDPDYDYKKQRSRR